MFCPYCSCGLYTEDTPDRLKCLVCRRIWEVKKDHNIEEITYIKLIGKL